MNLPGIVARFTERTGGRSESPYTSLNVGLHVGDVDEHVIQNRERVAEEIGIPLDRWVAGDQVHGSTVTVVTEDMRGRGARTLESLLPATDALITDVPGLALTTYAADCAPLLFADPVRRVVGAAHAGWKGTVAKIAGKTVRALVDTYGCDPADIRVTIGPTIGACCYEVDDRVEREVRAAFAEHEELLESNEKGRWQFDVPLANEKALLEAGVRPEHIERLDRCTSCCVDRQFSHRREQGRTGRHAGVIALLPDCEHAAGK
ncbi:MAG: peptidoglycan editing factor PgeF [Tumebacillaceae bacterium]